MSTLRLALKRSLEGILPPPPLDEHEPTPPPRNQKKKICSGISAEGGDYTTHRTINTKASRKQQHDGITDSSRYNSDDGELGDLIYKSIKMGVKTNKSKTDGADDARLKWRRTSREQKGDITTSMSHKRKHGAVIERNCDALADLQCNHFYIPCEYYLNHDGNYSVEEASENTTNDVAVGDVGYTFRKQFDDGWYTGRVVVVHDGDGLSGEYSYRRCVYEDGDSEDLTVNQLHLLALLDPESESYCKSTTVGQRKQHQKGALGRNKDCRSTFLKNNPPKCQHKGYTSNVNAVRTKPTKSIEEGESGSPRKRRRGNICSHAGCTGIAAKEGICGRQGGKRKRKKCSHEGCTNHAQNEGVCFKHGAKRRAPQRCSHAGCTNKAIKAKEGVCIRHGGTKYVYFCSHEGCTNRVQNNGLCFSHGAKRNFCNHEGCTNIISHGGVCWKHGGKKIRKKCSHEGCTNVGIQRGVCKRHGAKVTRKKCSIEGCTIVANSGGLCKRHFKAKLSH